VPDVCFIVFHCRVSFYQEKLSPNEDDDVLLASMIAEGSSTHRDTHHMKLLKQGVLVL